MSSNQRLKYLQTYKPITDLHNLFINSRRYFSHPIHKDNDESDAAKENQGENADEYHQYFEVGRQVKIRWSKDEMGDTGWREGWYNAEVQESELSSDEITVVYVSEPESTYKVEVTPLLANGKLKLN